MNIRQRLYTIAHCVLLALASTISNAETVFVIDELQIGVHAEQQITSPILETIDSGAALTVLQREGNFVKIKTENGREGWVDSAYVATTRPMAARFKALTTTNEALRAELSTLRSEAERLKSDLLDSEENRKRQIAAITHTLEAEIEARDAQINALNQPQETQQNNNTQASRLQAEIERLRAQVNELRTTSVTNTNAPIPSDALREMQRLAEENRNLKNQLTLAEAATHDLQSRLDENPPASAVPLPPTPTTWSTRWQSLNTYDTTAVILAMVLIFMLGAQFESYMVRRRHGGFRL